MDVATFERELARYRPIRSRSYVDTSGWTRAPTTGAARKTNAAVASPSAHNVISGAVAVGAATSAGPGDFWSEMDQFIGAHFTSPAARASVTRELDAAHYSMLRSMNLEDIGALAAMMRSELEPRLQS